MIPTKTIQLDFWRHPTDILHLVQGEADGRKVQFKITDNGSVADLTGFIAIFAIKKPDGNVVVNSATITEAELGIVETTISSQVVTTAGNAHAELHLMKEGQLSKSFRIVTKVAPGVDIDGIAPSVSEFNALQTLITDVNGWQAMLDARVDQIITTPAESVSAQEIIDARDGAATLGSRIDAIEDRASRAAKIYGVKFTGSNSAGVRTHDAVGMVANVGVDDQIVVNDFDNASFFQRPRCLVYHDEDGRAQVMAYEGEPGFSLTGAVFPPHAEKAQVFYEQKPFYWNGDLDWPQVTATPLEGFELAPMFKNPVDKVYLPSYWMGEDGGKACSLSGTYPSEISINTGMTSARTYHPRAHLETMDARICEYVLQLVEFATRDVQTVMMGASSMRYNNANDISILAETGVNRIVMANASADAYVVGQTICIGTTQNGSQITPRVVITAIETYDASSKSITFDGPPLDIPLGAFTSTRAYRNGATDVVKASSGSPVSNSSGKYPCIWRGKVDPWGMGFSGISDVLIQRAGEGTPEDPYSYTPYRLPDPTLYNAGVIDGNWVKVGYNLETKNGYVTALGRDPKSLGVRMTTDVDGSPVSSATNYFASYYYYPQYAVSAVFVGGIWNFGRNCSPVFFYLSYTPSSSGFVRLARLFVAPL